MNMPQYRKIFLIHGFNVTDEGQDTVVKAGRFFQGTINTMVINYPYGWFGLIGVMLKNKKIAAALAKSAVVKSFNVDVSAIGHSNGCAIIIEAARQGAHFDQVVLINPALKSKTRFPMSIKRVLVIYTKHDTATRVARFLEKIPFLKFLIPDCWGAMGAVGYRGSYDDRVTNADLSDSLNGHSDFFEDSNLRNFMPRVNQWAFKNRIF